MLKKLEKEVRKATKSLGVDTPINNLVRDFKGELPKADQDVFLPATYKDPAKALLKAVRQDSWEFNIKVPALGIKVYLSSDTIKSAINSCIERGWDPTPLSDLLKALEEHYHSKVNNASDSNAASTSKVEEVPAASSSNVEYTDQIAKLKAMYEEQNKLIAEQNQQLEKAMALLEGQQKGVNVAPAAAEEDVTNTSAQVAPIPSLITSSDDEDFIVLSSPIDEQDVQIIG